MTKYDLISLSPLLILALAPVVIMAGVTISRSFRLAYGFSLLMFVTAFVSLFFVSSHVPHHFGSIMTLDRFGLVFLGIIYLTAILVTIISYEYLRLQFGQREEYFIILFVAVLGASVIIFSQHFISFFLGLETLSVSLYVMIAYLKWRKECVEAGIKFLIIASAASAFLLFGMGLVYAATGTMSFTEIGSTAMGSLRLTPAFLAGIGLIISGIGFKLAFVPFHTWTPDVYQGAPMPVTAFIATVSKGALLALALRFFLITRVTGNKVIFIVLVFISIASMFTGNLLALKQVSLKRLLAYSSIAHFGYLLITILAGTEEAMTAAIFYITAYIISSLGAFGSLSALSVCEYDADKLSDLRGLFRSNPLVAFVLTLSMLSLAGLPVTAGFISKFYIVLAGGSSALWLLVFSLVIASLISFYYYFRVIGAIFTGGLQVKRLRVPATMSLILAFLALFIILMGIAPSVFVRFISMFTSMN